MIHANELRLHNWVKGPKENSWFTSKIGEFYFTEVQSISGKGINHWQDMGASGETKFEDLNGIPLTEELLLKFGFEKHLYGKYGFLGYRKHWIDGVLSPENIFSLMYYNSTHINIQYVHQLQNLYFALTGKELEFKKENNGTASVS